MRRPAARTRSRSRAAMGTGTGGSGAASGGAAGRRGGGRRSGGRQRQGCGRQHACGSLSSVELSVWEPRPKLRLRRLALASAARLHRDWRWLGPAPLFAGSAGAGAKASVDWGRLDGLDSLGRRLASFLSGDDCGVPRTARSRPGAAVQEARDGLGGLIPSAICCARAVCMAMMAAIRRRLCAHTRSCRSDRRRSAGWGWDGVGAVGQSGRGLHGPRATLLTDCKRAPPHCYCPAAHCPALLPLLPAGTC